MTFVISDLHGYPLDRFLQLLDRGGYDSERDALIVLGDTVDRGPDGVALLLWMMEQPNLIHLLGNHEAMLLSVGDLLLSPMSEELTERLTPEFFMEFETMLANGAETTLASLNALTLEDPQRAIELLEYLRQMPLYHRTRIGGVTCVMTHAGLGGFSPEKRLEDYEADELLWHRPAPTERYYEDKTHVIFGHTPTVFFGTPGQICRQETWTCIDTSDTAPTLLRLEDGAAFQLTGARIAGVRVCPGI